MKTTFAVAMSVTLMTLTGAVFAYPTLAGPSGIVAVPTAQVTHVGQWQLAADYYNTNDTVTGVRDTVPIRLLYGIAPNLEVGVAGWLARVDGTNADSGSANIKYLTPIHLAGFNLATGAVYAVTEAAADEDFTRNAKTLDIYLTGTRTLIGQAENMPLLQGTLGVNWTKIDAGAEKGDGLRLMGGLQFMPMKKLGIAAEYQTKRAAVGDDKALASAVVRYMLGNNMKAEAGITNAGFNYAGLTGAPDYNPFVGLTYEWGATAK